MRYLMEKILLRKKRNLQLGRNQLYFLFASAFAFPVLGAHLFSLFYGKTPLILPLFLSVFTTTLGLFLLNYWEGRMKVAVQRLVDDKCKSLNLLPISQLDQIKKEYHQAALSYEHQIDLLQSSVQKSKEQAVELNLQMDKKLEQMRLAYLEFEDLRKEYNRLAEEYERYKVEIQGQLKHKESLASDYQKTIAEQRQIIEKKQQYISRLEGKVRDLMYEIKALLHVDEPLLEKIPLAREEDELPLGYEKKPYDFALQLTRYLEMAEGFMGADHLGGRFLDSMAHQYAIDLRPLIDRLREESAGILFIYSPFDAKFLFVGKMVKILLGWSGEKFARDFPEIVQMGYPEWERAISDMAKEREKKLRLVFRTKTAGERPLDCYMGLIRKGPFANLAIGIML